MSKVIAVILAGGSGNRFGADIPKQFMQVHGRTILEHSVLAFASHQQVDEVIVVSREDWISFVKDLLSPHRDITYAKVSRIIPGGKERYHSTLAALDCCTHDDDILLIHDAVRPMIDASTISQCIHALTTDAHSASSSNESATASLSVLPPAPIKACAVGVPSTDTIWMSKPMEAMHDSNTEIRSIPPRTTLWNAQTPQCFRRCVLRQAYDLALRDPSFVSSDDCGVVKTYLPDLPIRIIEGKPTNIKITYPSDLELAEKWLK